MSIHSGASSSRLTYIPASSFPTSGNPTGTLPGALLLQAGAPAGVRPRPADSAGPSVSGWSMAGCGRPAPRLPRVPPPPPKEPPPSGA